MTRCIHVCGQPATGKTTLSHELAARLGLQAFGIDAERIKRLRPGAHWPADDGAAWRGLRDAIGEQEACIVETSGRSAKDRILFAPHARFVVLCRAERRVRVERLRARAYSGYPLVTTPSRYVRLMLRIDQPLLRPDAVWDSTLPSAAALDALSDRLATWVAGPDE